MNNPKKNPTKKEIEANLNSLKTAYQAQAADIIQLRRRAEQVGQESKITASRQLLLELLPIIDNLQRAFDSPPVEIKTIPWVKGVLMIEKSLLAQLTQIGLEPIKTIGEPFDPGTMAAVGIEPDSTKTPGTVTKEMTTGYKYLGEVLRVAQVQVASEAKK